MAGGVEPFTDEAVARGLSYLIQGPVFGADSLWGYGCGFADLDNDGDQDIILTGKVDHTVGLFENNGSGVFTNRSVTDGIPALTKFVGFAAADYDGDALIDIYITRLGPAGKLYKNLGGFVFTDVTDSAGITFVGPGQGCAWADFNNDGWLDLHIASYNSQTPNSDDIDDVLYQNDGDGTFTDVSVAQTVDEWGYGFQAVWSDYDRDGDVDLYLSQDRGHMPPLFRTNQLWRNDEGQMVNVSVGSGADVACFSMGLACGDFDGNSYPDFYVTNIATPNQPLGPINPLLLNQTDGTFVESSVQYGVANYFHSWGCIFFDYNNDGFNDLYVNNQFDPNTFFQGGSLPCMEVAAICQVQGNAGWSYTSAVGDADNDGDLDLLVPNLSNNVQLFINHEGDNRNWVRYQFVGQGANHLGIGGNVETRVGQTWHFNEVYVGGNGFLGQNETVLTVGLDAATFADEAIAQWPGGKTTRTYTSIPANALITLYPPERLGDHEGDSDVDAADFYAFAECNDAASVVGGCEVMDFDGNFIIDDADFDAFVGVYGGEVVDCDDNGVIDLLDILLDRSLDRNGDAQLDDCGDEFNPADFNEDGVVGPADLGTLLAAWGQCPPPEQGDCVADIAPPGAGDGVVSAADLAQLLANWG
jgi:hypothetical protein